MALEDGQKCAFYGCGVIFLLSVILFAVSFDTLEPHYVAIKYNNNLKVIDNNRIYNNGRYFLGLGLSFIDFPIDCQIIDFRGWKALRMWSLEGQLVTVDLSLMYRLDRQYILDIYKRYELDYHSRLLQIAIRTAKKVSIQYTAEEFFLIRGTIGEHMRAEMRRRLEEEKVTLELFNLREILIPSKFEAKVIEKQIWEQRKKTKEFMKETAIRRASLTVMQGTAEAEKSLLIENATAIRNAAIESAKAKALQGIIDQQTLSYAEMQNTLSLTGLSLLKYRYGQLMGKLEESAGGRRLSYVIGVKGSNTSDYVPGPVVVNPTSAPTGSPTPVNGSAPPDPN